MPVAAVRNGSRRDHPYPSITIPHPRPGPRRAAGSSTISPAAPDLGVHDVRARGKSDRFAGSTPASQLSIGHLLRAIERLGEAVDQLEKNYRTGWESRDVKDSPLAAMEVAQ